MKKLRFVAMVVVVVAAISLVAGLAMVQPVAAQRGGHLANTPSGAPAVQHALKVAGGFFPILSPNATFHMDDGFGYHWSDTGNCAAFSGTITGAYPSGSSSGTCTKVAKGHYTSYWKAVNNQPDNCTNYTDWFEYFGDGANPPTNQSGNWNSYCGNTILNSGTWSGVVARGPSQ